MNVIILLGAFFGVAHASVDLQSIEIVSCVNKAICYEGKNLRLEISLSTPTESSAGSGTINGVITGGQQWTDSYGDWELDEDFTITLDYNGQWVYTPTQTGSFWTKYETACAPFLGFKCDEQTNGIDCGDKGGLGLFLLNGLQYDIYAFDAVNNKQWDVSASIVSQHVNHAWNADQDNTETEVALAEISLQPLFSEDACFLNFNNYYGVMRDADELFYIISTDYFQNTTNNLNLSASAWEGDFNCNWTYPGWNVVIPFYETEAEYTGNGLTLTTLIADQMGLWKYNWGEYDINKHFYQWINSISTDCQDLTTYSGGTGVQGPPSNGFRSSKVGLVNHWNLTLDLDYTQFVKIPTTTPSKSPSQTPSKLPTKSPTRTPTRTPTTTPTKYPSRSPSRTPTKYPSKNPTTTPTSQPTKYPTEHPSKYPTVTPTRQPSTFPTEHPTQQPSDAPTKYPTEQPTETPSKYPTEQPSETPSKYPTEQPSDTPTQTPSTNPSQTPSQTPSQAPSTNPTEIPSASPTIRLDPFEAVEVQSKLEISASAPFSEELFDSKAYRDEIRQDIASSLDINIQLVRLDSIILVTNNNRRRLQTYSYEISFTIFTEPEKAQEIEQKVESTETFQQIETNLKQSFPEIESVFQAPAAQSCDPGTQSKTILGRTTCLSICTYYQYYDSDSNTCIKDPRVDEQTQTTAINTTAFEQTTIIIEPKLINKNRMINFGVGSLGWFILYFIIYCIFCKKTKKKKKSKSKQQKRYKLAKDNEHEYNDNENKKKKQRYSQTIGEKIRTSVLGKPDFEKGDSVSESQSDSDSDTDSDSDDDSESSSENNNTESTTKSSSNSNNSSSSDSDDS